MVILVKRKDPPVYDVEDSDDEGGTTPLHQVVAMFPHCDRAYIQRQLDSGLNVEGVVEGLLSMSAYPKETAMGYFAKPAAPKPAASKPATSNFDERCWDFSYGRGAVAVLRCDFRNVSVQSIRRVLWSAPYSRYWRAYETIRDCLAEGSLDDIVLLKNRYRGDYDPALICDELKRELEWHLSARGGGSAEAKEQEGDVYECGCCYDTFAFDEMVSCAAGDHMFCGQCIKRQVETVVFGGGKLELLCMDTDSGCKAPFPDPLLRKALSDDMLSKFDKKVAFAAAAKTCGERFCTCANCGVGFDLEIKTDFMLCPDPSCATKTCVGCRELHHPGRKCGEVDHGRLGVEEAITAARIRKCPRCRIPIVKDGGCSKIACQCGALSCWICRVDITLEGYQHFCNQPLCTHQTCGKCPCVTNDRVIEERELKEAAEKATRQAESKGHKVDVDINKLL